MASLRNFRGHWAWGFQSFKPHPLLAPVVLFLWPLDVLAFDPIANADVVFRQAWTYCVACHDGVLATEVHLGHPVGTSYLSAQIKRPTKLKPIGVLDSVAYLDDGRVVCLTCHHPRSQHPSKLVLSNAGSKLCLACHNF